MWNLTPQKAEAASSIARFSFVIQVGSDTIIERSRVSLIPPRSFVFTRKDTSARHYGWFFLDITTFFKISWHSSVCE